MTRRMPLRGHIFRAERNRRAISNIRYPHAMFVNINSLKKFASPDQQNAVSGVLPQKGLKNSGPTRSMASPMKTNVDGLNHSILQTPAPKIRVKIQDLLDLIIL